MVELEVRGIMTISCQECPLRVEELGGYDRSEIIGYHCKLTSRKLEERCAGFPKGCRLNPIKTEDSKQYQKMRRILHQVRDIIKIYEER